MRTAKCRKAFSPQDGWYQSCQPLKCVEPSYTQNTVQEHIMHLPFTYIEGDNFILGTAAT